MAKIDYVDGRKVRGKLCKKSKEVHRVRNGREQVYDMEVGPDKPSKAQKAHRSLFGATNAIVNRIMLDPEQVAIWEERMKETNRDIHPWEPPFPKRYETVREYVYDIVSKQLSQTPPMKRRKARLPLSLPRGVTLQIKTFQELSASELYEILKLRVSVFVVEQNCPYPELDDRDQCALHLWFRDDDGIQAYLRVLDRGAESEQVSIGRVIAVQRRCGLGSRILSEGIRAAKECFRADSIYLEAQVYAKGLYERQGFRPISEEFLLDGIPHVKMLLERTDGQS